MVTPMVTPMVTQPDVPNRDWPDGMRVHAVALAELRSRQAARAADVQAGTLPSSTGQANAAEAVVPSFVMPQPFGPSRQVVSSGFRSLDQLLPAGGVRRGSLVEWLADDAAGAVALAAAVACRLAGTPTFEQPAPHAATIVVVDRGARFHPPAVLPWLELPLREAPAAPTGGGGSGRGLARPQLVVARPSRDDDELWAIDQSLRCPGVAAVLAWPRRVHATAMRRWQLAARASGTVGLLVRGATGPITAGITAGITSGITSGITDAVRAARREPTWADARVAVSAVETAAGGDGCGPQPGISPAVRALRLSLVGGPWAGDAMLEERSTELWLDLTRGGESPCRRHAVASRDAPHRSRGVPQHASGMGGLACRAS